MILDKFTPMSYFEIWEPRYRDTTVLLACRKVGTHNKIVFTGNSKGYNLMGTEPYYVSGKIVKKCKKESNGRIDCFVVPLDKLETLELSANSELEFK